MYSERMVEIFENYDHGLKRSKGVLGLCWGCVIGLVFGIKLQRWSHSEQSLLARR